MGVGLAVLRWPDVITPDVITYARFMPLYEGVVAVLLTAMSLVAFLGLRYPVRSRSASRSRQSGSGVGPSPSCWGGAATSRAVIGHPRCRRPLGVVPNAADAVAQPPPGRCAVPGQPGAGHRAGSGPGGGAAAGCPDGAGAMGATSFDPGSVPPWSSRNGGYVSVISEV
jgi:hypothetical protein